MFSWKVRLVREQSLRIETKFQDALVRTWVKVTAVLNEVRCNLCLPASIQRKKGLEESEGRGEQNDILSGKKQGGISQNSLGQHYF